MTRVARIRGVNVVYRFTRCNGSIMTAGTGANDLRVIDVSTGDWCPGCWARLVAGITVIGTIYVRRTLARGNNPVMATDTATNNLVVVNCIVGYNPGRNYMTCLTLVTGINMTGALAGCFSTVMAGNTGFRCQAVVKSRDLPGCG